MGKDIYVVVLNGDEDFDSPTWDVVAKRDTQVGIEAVTQYSAFDRESISKSEYEGERFGNRKEILNTETGDTAHGNLYKLTKKREG